MTVQTFVITGASEGIGAELAAQLARRHGRGAALVLAARREAPLEAVAGRCREHGAAAHVVPTDVADQDQCRRLVDAAVRATGRIDTLINNAGMSAHALFGDVAPQDLQWYQRLMAINLWGSVWCTHAALPQLRSSRGRIVAVSSLAGLMGVPGRTAYSATKFAMTGFFEALRAEVKGDGISVTIAYPGVVATHIRHRGFNAAGRPAGVSGLHEEAAMSVQECARQIIAGMDRRQRDVVMTAQGKIGRFVKLVAPALVERIALSKLKEEARPR